MKNIILAVVTALTVAILAACGAAAPSASSFSKEAPVVQSVVDAPAKAVVDAPAQGYWTKAENKSFKAIEYSCTLGWKEISMPNGCVIVIDRKGGGYTHNGYNGPLGVVIPGEKGVTIKPAVGWDVLAHVSSEPKQYTFVVIDDKGAYIASQFKTSAPKWDDELLKEFFDSQMAGGVETIWREGVSNIDN